MDDRLYEDLEITLSSFSKHSIDDYNDEEDESEGDYDEEEVNDLGNEGKLDEELACPFCSEDFDVVGLCCHIDADHRMEVKPGICPVCSTKVGINMASHVIMQHENVLKALCNKKHHTARSRSAIYLLRKDLQEKHLRHIKEYKVADSYSDGVGDSMLMSFVNSRPLGYRPQAKEATASTAASTSAEGSTDDSLESIQPTLSTNWSNEQSRRCEFVRGLVLSTIFDDL